MTLRPGLRPAKPAVWVPMTPAAFRANLAALCWTQRSFAAMLGCPHNTVHRWARGQAAIPLSIATWLEEMRQHFEWHPPPRG